MSHLIDTEEEHYDIDDAIAAFAKLSDKDNANIMRVANFFAGHGNLADACELISEAYIRIADGRRRWPRGQEFLYFLAGVVKSLATDNVFATDSKKIRNLFQTYSTISDDDITNVADNHDSNRLKRKELQEEYICRLERHFEGDDEMQLFIMGIMDGLRGQSLADAVGVDIQRLEALRTRFNRYVDKLAAEHRAKKDGCDE